MEFVKIFLLCLFFSSCYTQKKAGRKVDQAHSYYPELVAEKTRSWFPCVVSFSDTIQRTDTLYDLIEVQCPDTIAHRVDSFETWQAVKVPVYIKVPIQRLRETKTVTIRIKDMAAVSACEIRADTLQGSSDKYHAGRNRWRKWCLWTWGAMGLVVLFKIFRSKIGL